MPYWWDRDVKSVATTLHLERPDIAIPPALITTSPIPTANPKRSEGLKSSSQRTWIIGDANTAVSYSPQKLVDLPMQFDTNGWYVSRYVII